MRTPITFDLSLHAQQLFALEVSDLLRDLVLDLVPGLLNGFGPELLKASDIAVGGTQQPVIAFKLDPIPLDLKLRATLRAGGFNVPITRHEGVSIAGIATAMVPEGAAAVMAAAAPEAL